MCLNSHICFNSGSNAVVQPVVSAAAFNYDCNGLKSVYTGMTLIKIVFEKKLTKINMFDDACIGPIVT